MIELNKTNNQYRNYIILVFSFLILINIGFAFDVNNVVVTSSDHPEIMVSFNENVSLDSYKISSTSQDYELKYEQLDKKNYKLSLIDDDELLNDDNYTLLISANDQIGNSNSFSIPFKIETPDPTITLLSPINGISRTSNFDFIVYTDKQATCKVSTRDLPYDQMPAFIDSDGKYHYSPYQFSPGINNFNLYVKCKDIKNKEVSEIFNLNFAQDISFTTDPYALPQEIVSSKDKKTLAKWSLNQEGYCKCSNLPNQNFNNMSEIMQSIQVDSQNVIFDSLEGIAGLMPEQYQETKIYCSQNSKKEYIDTSTQSKLIYEFKKDNEFNKSNRILESNVLLSDKKNSAQISYQNIDNTKIIYANIKKKIIYPSTYDTTLNNFNKITHMHYFQFKIISSDDKYNLDLLHLKNLINNLEISDTFPIPQSTSITSTINNLLDTFDYSRYFYSNDNQESYKYYIQCEDLSLSKKTSIKDFTYTQNFAKKNFINVIEPPVYTSIPSNRLNIKVYTPEVSDCIFKLNYPDSYSHMNSLNTITNDGTFGYGYYHSGYEQIDLSNAQFSQGQYLLEVTCTNDESLSVKKDYTFYIDNTPPENLTLNISDYACQSPDNKWNLFKYNNTNIPLKLSANDVSGIQSYNVTLLNSNQEILFKKNYPATNNIFESNIDLDSQNVALNYSQQYFINAIAIDNSGIASSEVSSHFQTLRFNDNMCKETTPPTININEKQEDGKVIATISCQDASGCKQKTINNHSYDAIYYRVFIKGLENCKEVENQGDSLIYKEPIEIPVNSTICYLALDTFDNVVIGNKTINVLPKDLDPNTNGIDNDWERQYFHCSNCVDKEADPDGDGLTNWQEYQEHTNPLEFDSDGDGYTDFEEIHFNTDPNNASSKPTQHFDFDNDGLNDNFELKYFECRVCANPNDDPDSDGLTNLEEQKLGTDPTKADTDGDKFNDKVEVDKNFDPLNPNSHPKFIDTDNDNLPDDWEIENFHNLDSDGNGDFDKDGLTNLEEYGLGTNPTLFDTDGDGWSDFDEYKTYNTNPLDANDHPTSWWTILMWAVILIIIIAFITFGGIYGYHYYLSQQNKKKNKPQKTITPKTFATPKPRVGLTPEQIARLKRNNYSSKNIAQPRQRKVIPKPMSQADLSRKQNLSQSQDYFTKQKAKSNPFDRLKNFDKPDKGDLFSKLKGFAFKNKHSNDGSSFSKLRGMVNGQSRTIKPRKDAVKKLKKVIKKKYDLDKLK